MNTPAVAVSATTSVRTELAQDTLRQFGVLRMRATGGSMLPAIAPGDLLTFRAFTPTDARPGQVLLVRCSERLVAHRLVGRAADGALLTCGDALAALDLPVPAGDVLGILVMQQRKHTLMLAGGRHWLRRQRSARWLIRRSDLAHRLFARVPALTALMA